jgi:HlyD family secretion protein
MIAAGGAVVIAGFMGLAMTRGRRGGIEVRTEEVRRRDLVAVVTASGRIRPHRSVDIQADVSGRIVDLRVEEGDTASVGDTLLIIDPTTFQAAVQRAQAALSSARAAETQAKANRDQAWRALVRTRQLKEENPDLISDQELEAAETNFEVQDALYQAARYQVAQAAATLREARDRLAKTVIQAPMSGLVTRLNVEEGETAIVGTMNNPGTVLLTVADLSEMEVVVEVDETDVPQIEVGDSARIEIDAFPDTTFVGEVTEIAHSSIQGGALGFSGTTADQAVDFEVVIRLDDPPEGLRTDLSATADIITEVRDSVLSIPIIALTLRKPKPAEAEETSGDTGAEEIELLEEGEEPEEVEGVFVVGEDNTVTFRPVVVGIAGREHFEVIEGLEGGEVIVAGSYQAIRQLEDGDVVKPTKKKREGGRKSEAE